MKRRLPPTREGWWFLIATFLVGAVAIDAGINLFFLTFGMMVCLLLASVLLAGLGLSGLQVRRIPPPVIHAGTPYLMGIALENRKRRLPSFSIEVEDLVDEHPIDKRCYFLKLPAGRTQETSYRHRLPRRGRHRLSGFRLATKFPFGLMQRGRTVVEPAEVVVYPALAALPPAILRGLPSPLAPSRRRAPNRQGELAGLRAFRPGDDPRDIHWRSSARRGRPLVREHEDDEGQKALIVFDNLATEEQRARSSTFSFTDAPFELAVSQAAALCVELVRRGLAVGLVTRGGEVPPAVGPRHLARLLGVLAFIQPEAPSQGQGQGQGQGGDGPLRARGEAIVRVRPGAAIVLEGARGPGGLRDPGGEAGARTRRGSGSGVSG
jgi:uncharacterized protein (DUF58 family)